MKLIRRFPLLAYGVVLLAIVGLCIAQESVELLLVAGGLAAVSWYVTEGPRGRFLPRWVSTLLIAAVVLNAGVELVSVHTAWIETLGRFAVWMTLIKLYDRKSPRDYAQLLLMSLLLMICGAVQSSELLFGIVLLLYAVLGLYVLLLFRLYASHDAARADRRKTSPHDYSLVPPTKAIFGRQLHRHFRRLTVGVGLAGLTLSVLVFCVFPRGLGEGTLPLLGQRPGRISGFSETIDLVEGTRITESRRLVMTVRVLDSAGQPQRRRLPMLLRGSVLDRYDGDGQWGSLPRDAPLKVAGKLATVGPGTGPLHGIEVELSSPQHVLFAAGRPVRVAPAGRIVFEPATYIIRREGAATRDGYRVATLLDPDDEALAALREGEPQPLSEHRGGLQRLRSDAVRDLAQGLLERSPVPVVPPGVAGSAVRWEWNRRAARVFRDYLQRRPFSYTTDLSDVVTRVDDPRDPIERFLLQTRRGHCEYFASALASLCANADIPVRLVAGYVAYGYDESRQRYMVLESNAHAWTEVRVGPDRWDTLDPTPHGTFERLHGGETTMVDRFSWIYERFEGLWNHSIASFDAGSQQHLAQSIDAGWGGWVSERVKDLRHWLDGVNRGFYMGPAGYIWMGVVVFALALAVAVLVKLMRRSGAVRATLQLHHFRGAEYQRLLRHLGFYLDMLTVLRRGRMEKPPWQPPLAHAAAIEGEHPEAASLVRAITTLAYRERFGGGALSREEMQAARSSVAELAELLGVRA